MTALVLNDHEAAYHRLANLLSEVLFSNDVTSRYLFGTPGRW